MSPDPTGDRTRVPDGAGAVTPDGADSGLRPFGERTVLHGLARSAGRVPDKPAVIDEDRQLTYRELTDRVDTLSAGLDRWLRRSGWDGEPVAVSLGNHAGHVLVWLALSALGVPQVEINPEYSGQRLRHILADSGARIAVADDSNLEALAAAGDPEPLLEHVLARSVSGGAPDTDTDATGLRSVTAISALDDTGTADGHGHAPDPSALMGIYYTSGTTGRAKGVRISHGQAYHYCRPGPLGAARADDVSLISLPLHHVGGLLWGVMNALLAGATAVIPRDFSVSGFWEVVDEHGVTFTTLVGAMVEYLLRETGARPNPLRAVCMAPVTASAGQFRERFGVELCSGYGSTEAGSPLACPVGSSPRPNELGWPREDYEVRVVDDRDVPVEPGETGELLVRPVVPNAMMSGYHGRPAFTVEQWRNLWYHTGDLVRETDRGSYELVGRKADVIRHRGENVSASEVEDALVRSGRVEEAAVVGVPSEYSEEDILAVLVWREGADRDLAGLVAFLDRELPGFAVPTYFRTEQELPRTATGKVRRFVLGERGLTGDETTAEPEGGRDERDG